MIIGVVGSIASGKDTMADYLKTKGFKTVSLSDEIRELMRAEGIETTVPNMTEYGNNLRVAKGHGFLAKKAIERIKNEDAIITSIRQVGEIETLKENPDFALVKLDAPIEMRLDRLLKRKREGDVESLNELKAIEAKQADGKNGAMNMNRCFEMADAEIINDGTVEELYQEVDKMIEKLRSEQRGAKCLA